MRTNCMPHVAQALRRSDIAAGDTEFRPIAVHGLEDAPMCDGCALPESICVCDPIPAPSAELLRAVATERIAYAAMGIVL